MYAVFCADGFIMMLLFGAEYFALHFAIGKYKD
jgi:hypothetical protein